MAYNSFYQPYQPVNYGQYQGYQPNPQMAQLGYQQAQQAAQPTIQNGGFVSVRSEIEARNYPVAPGNSVTFIDENAPYCYTKTMGFSQLDRPRFEKFRLVKEEEAAQPMQSSADAPKVDYALKSELLTLKDEFSTEILNLKAIFEKLSQKNENKTDILKKEVEINA